MAEILVHVLIEVASYYVCFWKYSDLNSTPIDYTLSHSIYFLYSGLMDGLPAWFCKSNQIVKKIFQYKVSSGVKFDA